MQLGGRCHSCKLVATGSASATTPRTLATLVIQSQTTLQRRLRELASAELMKLDPSAGNEGSAEGATAANANVDTAAAAASAAADADADVDADAEEAQQEQEQQEENAENVG